ncbi:hypothetical protein [Methanospirillum hungatei]|uniref:hypothetical protein n=1 Tax=Methanospirillum hungatei TaxID=2203 RepID=UPI0026E9E413|nr:hypothetical protein [Methanospirillum hungatei]MCA1914940.1 hypothetical protein [Methanospirillum hungatei]
MAIIDPRIIEQITPITKPTHAPVIMPKIISGSKIFWRAVWDGKRSQKTPKPKSVRKTPEIIPHRAPYGMRHCMSDIGCTD